MAYVSCFLAIIRVISREEALVAVVMLVGFIARKEALRGRALLVARTALTVRTRIGACKLYTREFVAEARRPGAIVLAVLDPFDAAKICLVLTIRDDLALIKILVRRIFT